MTFLVPTLVLAVLAAHDAGVDAGDYDHCPPAEPLVMVDGGYFATATRAERMACIIATCENERDARREQQSHVYNSNTLAAGAVSLAVIIGFIAGLLVPRK